MQKSAKLYQGVSTAVLLAAFLSVVSFTFANLTSIWTEHSFGNVQAIERQTAWAKSAVAITSATEDGATCTDFTAQAGNSGKTPIYDFSAMDLVVEYTNTSDAKAAAWLTHGPDWSVTASRRAPATPKIGTRRRRQPSISACLPP
jgi:hypothetical protein